MWRESKWEERGDNSENVKACNLINCLWNLWPLLWTRSSILQSQLAWLLQFRDNWKCENTKLRDLRHHSFDIQSAFNSILLFNLLKLNGCKRFFNYSMLQKMRKDQVQKRKNKTYWIHWGNHPKKVRILISSILFLLLVIGTVKMLVRMLFILLESIPSLVIDRKSRFNDVAFL